MDERNFAALIQNLLSSKANPEEDFGRLLTEAMNAENHGGYNPEMESERLRQMLGSDRIRSMLGVADAPQSFREDSPQEMTREDLVKLLRGSL